MIEIDTLFVHRDEYNLRRGWEPSMLHHTFMAPYSFYAVNKVLVGQAHNPYMNAWYWRDGQITADPSAQYAIKPTPLLVGHLYYMIDFEEIRVPYDVTFRCVTRYGAQTNFAITHGMAGLSRPAATIAWRYTDGTIEVMVIGIPSPLGQFFMTFTSLEKDAHGIVHPFGMFCADLKRVEEFLLALPV